MSWSGRRPFRMSWSGWETLSNAREALSDVREWSGGLEWSVAGCPGVIRRPFRKSGNPYRMSGSGRLVLSDVPDW